MSETLTKLQEHVETLFNSFCADNGYEPRFAECEIKWKDGSGTCEVVFKLTCDIEENEDEEIFYYCNSFKDILSMTTDCTGEDFIITNIFSFT